MKRYIWIILLMISIFPVLAFFVSGLPVTHDGQDHVARIANFYQSLSEGVIVPRWAGNLNWGYGHPILMFLYPMSSYTASLFHSIGFSFVDATKGVFIVGYIASVLSMYLWMSTVWGKRAGVIGALLYGFAPYRFVDMYVRMAIGEHMAFVFPPLICYFLYKFATGEGSIKYGLGLSIGVGFLILSHNAISLMFLPLIGLYILYLYFFEANKSFYFICTTICFILLGFGLSAFFWVPAFVEGKYTLRNIVTAGMGAERFVPIQAFFYPSWNVPEGNMITKSLGYFQWVGVMAAVCVAFLTKDKKLRILLFVLCLLLFASLWIMTSHSAWIWNHVIILQNFQFPWRFLSLTTFIAAVLGGISISTLFDMCLFKENKQKNNSYAYHAVYLLFIIFCLLLILSTSHMWKPKAYQNKDESFYTGIYNSTTDTGESSPIWTTRFMEQRPKAQIEVISGIATVEQLRRTSTLHEYRIGADTRAELLENTIYFPGWTIVVDGKDTDIQFQSEIHRGIMSFWVDKGEHHVDIVFRDTKVRSISNIITIVSGIVLVLWCMMTQTIWKKRI